MGGAFVGVADDATAAFNNPAGLTVLNRPEVSAEETVSQSVIPVNAAKQSRAGIRNSLILRITSWVVFAAICIEEGYKT